MARAGFTLSLALTIYDDLFLCKLDIGFFDYDYLLMRRSSFRPVTSIR